MLNQPTARNFWTTAGLLAFLAIASLSGFAQAQRAAPNGNDNFTFIVTADVHFGAFPQSRTWLEKMIAEVNAMDPLPAFILNCGDETERGWESEWAGYQEVISHSRIPVYHTPGNHDVKWADLGKQRFRNYNHGQTYYSFDYGRYHFVSLDVTVTLQQYAHVEKEVLRWLIDDLSAVSADHPVILFYHHPMGRWKFYVDNQYEVLKVLSRFKVKLIFQGHEHNEEIWNENGITQVNVNNLYGTVTRPGWYRIVQVNHGVITIYNKRPDEAPIVSRAVINMNPEKGTNHVEITRSPEPLSPGSTQYQFEAQVHNHDLTPAFIGKQITDDGVFWNGINGFYQFSLRTHGQESVLKVRIDRSSELLAAALQTQRRNGSWKTIDWSSKTHDDNCGERCLPVDNQFWIDLKFRIPKRTRGPFRMVSFTPSAPEINAFYMWLTDRQGSLLDEIDVGDAQSESKHAVSVIGETGRRTLTSIYPTAVRYWLDITYLGGGRRPMVPKDSDLWSATFDGGSQKPGRHTVRVQVFDDTGRAYTDFVEFSLAGGTFKTLAALPTGAGIQSSPAVAEGRVYFGSNDGKVYAFRSMDPTPVWSFPTGDQVISSPTVVNGVVYVGSADFKLYALDASTGSEIWEFATRGPIFGAPEVVHGVAYVGSGDHNLYAIDTATGIEKWRSHLEDPNALIQMKPTYFDGVVYFGAWDMYVYAVSAEDGTLRWRTKIPNSTFYTAPAYQSPRIIADKVLVSAPTGFHYLFAKTTGALLGDPFPSPASSFGYNDPWVDGDDAYSISFGGTLISYDLSGSVPLERWRTALGFQAVNSGVLLSHGQLLVGGFKDGGATAIHGSLISIDASTREVNSYSLASQAWVFSRVGVGDELIYLGTLDGNLYVVGPASD